MLPDGSATLNGDEVRRDGPDTSNASKHYSLYHCQFRVARLEEALRLYLPSHLIQNETAMKSRLELPGFFGLKLVPLHYLPTFLHMYTLFFVPTRLQPGLL